MADRGLPVAPAPAKGILSIRIGDEVGAAGQRESFGRGPLAAVSLVKDYGLNVMLMLLKKGPAANITPGPSPCTWLRAWCV